MKFFFTLILLATTLVVAVNGQKHIPGADDLFAMGFDRVQGKPSADPVVLLHYTMGQTWSPPDNPDLLYQVPDELFCVDQYQSVEMIAESIQSSYHEFFEAYCNSFSISLGIGTSTWSLGFKFDHEIGEAKDIMNSQLVAMGMSYHYYTLYQLGMAPPSMLTLHPFFEMAINKLPPTIQTPDDQRAYDDIIRYFGTDYVYQSNFGIRVDVNSFVNQTFVNKYTQKWIANQFSLNFRYYMFDISPGIFVNKSQIHVDEEFRKNAFTRIYFRGGNPIYQNNATLPQWVQSLETYPQYLNTSMQSIATLVKDKQKAATLSTVIQNYIKTGVLPSDIPKATVPKERKIRARPSRSELKKQKVKAIPPIPGLDVVGCGYNAATDKVTGTCVVKYSFADDNSHVWQNPDYPQYVYNVPKEIHIQNTPESFLFNGTFIEETVFDWWKVTEKRSSSHGFLGFSSKSEFTYEYYQRYWLQAQQLAFNVWMIAWYTMTVPPLPPPPLHPIWEREIESLPSTYDATTQQDYFNAIDAFGTHYVASADFGGQITTKIWFHKCFIDEYSQVDVEKWSKWSFFGIIGGGHGESYHDKRINANFSQESESFSEVLGGDVTLAPNQWALWLPTVKLNPVPLSHRVVELYTLIRDPVKQANWKQAVSDYMAKKLAESTEYSKKLESQQNTTKPSWCTVNNNDNQEKKKEEKKEEEKKINPNTITPVQMKVAASIRDLAAHSIASKCPYQGYKGPYCPDIGLPCNPQVKRVRGEIYSLPARIGIGLDISTGELLLPVFQMTDSQSVYTAPNGISYYIPKEVSFGLKSDSITSSKLFKTEEEYAATWAFNSDGSGSGNRIGGLFSHSKSVNELYSQIFAGTTPNSVAVNQQEVHTFGMTAMSTGSLDTDFISALQYLPLEYDSYLYSLLIQYWGTHVITEADFGGFIEQQVLLKQCLWQNGVLNDPKIEEQALIDLHIQIEPNKPPPQQDSLYVRSRKAGTIDIIGGNPEISDIPSRIATFGDNPVITRYTYQPITNFIPDPTIRANVQRAIQEYLSNINAQKQKEMEQVAAAKQAAFLGPRKVYLTYSNLGDDPKLYDNENCLIAGSQYYGELTLSAGQSGNVQIPVKKGTWPSQICTRNAQGQLQATYDYEIKAWKDLCIELCYLDDWRYWENCYPYGYCTQFKYQNGNWVDHGCSVFRIFGDYSKPPGPSNGYACCFDSPPLPVSGKTHCKGNPQTLEFACPTF